jgi:hypothetical protein
VIIAGFAAGTVFLIVNALLMPLLLRVNWPVLLRYMASLVRGPSALNTTDVGTLALGLLVHYAVSLLFALIVAVVVHRWGLWVGIFGGAVLGLALYGINFYGLTLAYPWFFAINGPLQLASHVLFGAVAGGIYETFDYYDVPFAVGGTADGRNR